MTQTNVRLIGALFASVLMLSACNTSDENGETQTDGAAAEMRMTDSTTDDAHSPDMNHALAMDAGAMSDSRTPEVDGALPAPTGELVIDRDLDYTLPEGVASNMAKMDIYRRDDGVIRPLMLFVHGGSWVAEIRRD